MRRIGALSSPSCFWRVLSANTSMHAVHAMNASRRPLSSVLATTLAVVALPAGSAPTSTLTSSAPTVIDTETDPSSGVYFTALSTMLSITRASSSGSPKTTTGVVSGRSKWSRTPACLARMLSRSTLASHSSTMSTARRTVSRRPWIRE